jgi:hypothetical protein
MLVGMAAFLAQFAPEAVYASRTLLFGTATAELIAEPVRDPVNWPAAVGPEHTDDRVLVYVIERARYVDAEDTVAPVIEPATSESDWALMAMLRDAAESLAAWSGGAVRPRFEIHRVTVPVDVVTGTHDGVTPLRWVDPASLEAAVGTLPAADMVVTLFPDAHARANVGGLSAPRVLGGSRRPYLSIPAHSVPVNVRPGEALVHEFCHGLGFLAEAAGTPRIDLHGNARYGYGDRHGSYAAWYAFYLTHPTITAALADRTSATADPVTTR